MRSAAARPSAKSLLPQTYVVGTVTVLGEVGLDTRSSLALLDRLGLALLDRLGLALLDRLGPALLDRLRVASFLALASTVVGIARYQFIGAVSEAGVGKRAS
ncbi:hypothetical protein GCM10025872_02720 [Barrientosiimonas endolithica]|uniref:Uncharacterized protein n=1 Tax=Barrientosiimonas endolithica TaxID=1535208 RepID=A0ABN6YKV0_9MICO|nr:hypothetical protein GCM10025872_02720 [Barrientosiimonas endolithica]